jgi:peptide deformylase
MKQLGGVGLSANQVGLDMRVFVMGLGETKIAVFNPEILEYSDTEELFNEGCLSYPGIMLSIKRPTKITAAYQDETGKYIEQEFNGLTARVFQHELDHMNGTDYTDRVSKFKLDFAKKKFENKRKKIIKKYAVKTMIEALNDSKDTN